MAVEEGIGGLKFLLNSTKSGVILSTFTWLYFHQWQRHHCSSITIAATVTITITPTITSTSAHYTDNIPWENNFVELLVTRNFALLITKENAVDQYNQNTQ